MKKIGDLFKKKDINVEIATVNAKLMQLETKFKAQIRMEVNALKNSNRKRKENAAAYSRLKNAYYCLQLVYVAMERMDEISSTYHLTKSINELSGAMKMVNKLDGKSDKVNELFLRFRTKKMLRSAEESAESGMRDYFSSPIDELVDDSVVEDLLKGKPLADVLNDDVDTIDNIDDLFGFCDEYSKDLGAAGIHMSDNYEQSMKELDDMISRL